MEKGGAVVGAVAGAYAASLIPAAVAEGPLGVAVLIFGSAVVMGASAVVGAKVGHGAGRGVGRATGETLEQCTVS
jgi:hypothetical protein